MFFGKKVLYFCIFCLLISGCAKESNIKNINSKGRTVVCFGDSLTSGEGASPGNDYPSILARHIEFPVINAGNSGDTTNDALKRIKEDVINQNPKLVIIEFGGNDFLRGAPKEETFKNLDEIIKRIQEEAKSMVVLLEVRTAFIGDEYLPGFKKIAKRRRALLIPDILKGITTNPKLKSDYIHPNDEGYRIMAQRVYKAIKRILR